MPHPAHLLAYGTLRGVETLIRSLPIGLALRAADAVGDIWWALDGRRRMRTRENLRITGLAGGDARDARHRVRRVFRAMARVPVEASLAERHLQGRAGRRRCRLLGVWAELEREAAAGRPTLVVTGHLGNWEIGARVLRARVPDARVVARPMEIPLVEDHVALRRGGPEAVIQKRGALRGALRALRDGASVAILADQDAGHAGCFVPFFGLLASTTTAPALLAARSGAPVYLGICLRRPEPLCFDVHLVPLLGPGHGASGRSEVPAVTAALTRELEAWVRRAPEQYNWLHRRWKTRPHGEGATAPRPAYARLARVQV